jgi:excisionase family DNA binding protein
MEDAWLTVNEAAERLAMNPQFIYDACAVMGLKHARVGRGRGRIRIRATWLEEWVEARTLATA